MLDVRVFNQGPNGCMLWGIGQKKKEEEEKGHDSNANNCADNTERECVSVSVCVCDSPWRVLVRRQ